MEGELRMSRKERERMRVLPRVERGEIKLKDAAVQLGLSYRQTRRIWKRYREGGDAGLVHRARGRPSNRGVRAATGPSMACVSGGKQTRAAASGLVNCIAGDGFVKIS